jgi:hypothetical protein
MLSTQPEQPTDNWFPKTQGHTAAGLLGWGCLMLPPSARRHLYWCMCVGLATLSWAPQGKLALRVWGTASSQAILLQNNTATPSRPGSRYIPRAQPGCTAEPLHPFMSRNLPPPKN